MFYCYVHNWSNPQYSCPKCNPIEFRWTTNVAGGNKMKTYPLIQKLGLKLHDVYITTSFGSSGTANLQTTIIADDLESLLSKAQRVYGKGQSTWVWGDRLEPYSTDTHAALLIAVEPIVKGVRKSEIIKEMRRESLGPGDILFELADRIEKEGVIDD